MSDSGLDCHSDEVLHEQTQAYILSEVVTTFNSSIVGCERGGVNSDFDLPLVRITWLADEEPGQRESLLHYELGIIDGCLKQVLKVFVVGIIVVARILPLNYGLSLPDDDVEEGV